VAQRVLCPVAGGDRRPLESRLVHHAGDRPAAGARTRAELWIEYGLGETYICTRSDFLN
jgi:hypothetical protein